MRYLHYIILVGLVTACSPSQDKGLIHIDGSSTVYPIHEAAAEEFLIQKGGRVVIGVSGTGGGFKKFCNGEVGIVGASRPIKASEAKECLNAGVGYIELPIAYDGIAVVVHPDNDWVDSLTVDQLKRMWEPEAQRQVLKWSDVEPEWPDKPLRLMGPGVDSGTYDYFTEAVIGKEGASRGDIISSEDDNVLVMGVTKDPHALAFFGFAYYAENKDRLKVVGIDEGRLDNPKGPVLPTPETISRGSYLPLSRPLMIYIRADQAERPAIQEFVHFYLKNATFLVPDVGFIALPESTYERVRTRFDARTTGSLFGAGSTVGLTVDELLNGDANE